jgi:H+/Cl- antiporter ClcA
LTSGLIIGAVILAGLTSLAFLGNYTYFGTSDTMLSVGADWLAVPVCGVVGGLCGGLFSRLLIAFPRALPGKIGKLMKAQPVATAALCGLVVAICGLISGGSVFGTGYEEARNAVHSASGLSLFYAPLKFLATVASSVSGVPGGIFSPSLAVGAGIGNLLTPLFPSEQSGAIVLLGMAGYFVGVVRAPLTAVIILSETTGSTSAILPLFATCLIGDWAGALVCRERLYHALARDFMPPTPPPSPPSAEENRYA